jgi:hypothetical protein
MWNSGRSNTIHFEFKLLCSNQLSHAAIPKTLASEALKPVTHKTKLRAGT